MDAYDYGLPDSAIAQRPIEPRTAARLLVGPGLDGNRSPEHATVADLPRLLRPGDVVVVNDTRVLAARLTLVKATGGRAEVLLLEPVDVGTGVLGGPGAPRAAASRPTPLYEPHAGAGSPPVAEVGRALEGTDGRRSVRLLDPSVVERAGCHAPAALHPPTARRPGALPDGVRRAPSDRTTGRPPHPPPDSTSPPSCSRRAAAAGAAVARVDLAIGLDTFRPITAPTAEEHVIHTERYSVPAETMAACARRRAGGGRGHHRGPGPGVRRRHGELAGRTDLYIHGDYPFARGRRAGHQLPPAPLQPAAAGGGVLRAGVAGPVRHRPGRGLPLPVLRRRHGGGPRPPRSPGRPPRSVGPARPSRWIGSARRASA